MQQMEHNGDVLQELCPEQALETSAIAGAVWQTLVSERRK